MSFVLLDASVMVALFDDAEESHAHYADKLSRHGSAFSLVTSWPCVTEASYLLSPRNHMALLYWLHRGGALVRNMEVADLGELLAWMKRYTERGKTLMDLADASLVWLAIELRTSRIFTEDRRDFLRYRLPDGTSFEVLH
ncbi:MAG TPA: PIN domain-containing protein [Ramlibacter sp.]|uniref:PIN domain-containing protein n=1 Tax=Ramlibacter sp. TaxID=1917967 RepID=UPI002BA03DCB|nr:PIN domain-containing protein [Ramlibacter sp.]HVZ46422.1 PIN domain-containing protein [Ramlibacter sp.]